jgi:hypothetical protein
MGAGDRSWLASCLLKPPTLSFGSVRAWVDDASRRVALAGRVGEGVLDLAAAMGTIDPHGALDDGYTMLTVAAGLLLAARGRVLLHGAAIRRPDGGVVLLAGDTHCGKSTTALTIARAPGWAWLSDDQVVLAPLSSSAVEVLAWARLPHLDAGYHQGESTGERRDASPELLGSLPWTARGALAATVLPQVRAAQPSGTRPASAGSAMEALVRQGAWIMAEPGSARLTLGVLRAAAGLTSRFLDLGLDSYGRPDRLAELLDEIGSKR